MEVGGDFFQIIPEENGETVIVLGDVSGKGLKAAMAVSLIVGLVRALAPMISDPGKLLAEVNERLFGRLQGGFATALALRLDAQGNCDLACAGHLPPFVNGEEIDLPGAFPLGIANGAAYDTVHFQLRSSDRLALFTDGLLEARSGSGELYGFERMQTLFATKPTAAQATQAAVEFGQDDDITVLILTRLGIGEESISQPSAPVLSPGWLPRPS
jgi:serine phosphatase RsbU (regulator of sigma subunit)